MRAFLALPVVHVGFFRCLGRGAVITKSVRILSGIYIKIILLLNE